MHKVEDIINNTKQWNKHCRKVLNMGDILLQLNTCQKDIRIDIESYIIEEGINKKYS